MRVCALSGMTADKIRTIMKWFHCEIFESVFLELSGQLAAEYLMWNLGDIVRHELLKLHGTLQNSRSLSRAWTNIQRTLASSQVYLKPGPAREHE